MKAHEKENSQVSRQRRERRCIRKREHQLNLVLVHFATLRPLSLSSSLAHHSADMADAPASGRHIDDLPDEVFAKILNLVPIKQVVRCAVISKRWNAASAYVIRTRESLSIGYNNMRPPERSTSWQMHDVTLKSNRLVSAMMIRLNQMVELKRLRVAVRAISLTDITPLIRKFSDQLTILEIDFAVSMIGADVFPHLTRLRCDLFDPNSSAVFPKLAELVVDRLRDHKNLLNMRLPSLKKLIIESFWESDEELVRGFILANAENLTVLEMNGLRLRLVHAVVFPNLIRLLCHELDVVTGCLFPALTQLTVVRQVTAEFLTRLPADQMLCLVVVFLHQMERKGVVTAISKMKNLKILKLTDSGLSEAGDALSSIFDDMHHLEKVRLVSYFNCFTGDAMISTLANQNPKLSDVNFDQIHLTDAALTSLAQLQHLTDVEIIQRDQKQKVTTAGVLTLLRGSSRNVIRKFRVSGEKVDGDQVSREISLMCEERGTTFDESRDGFYFNYEMRASS